MPKKLCLVLSVVVTTTMLPAACAPAAMPTAAPAAPTAALVQPTTAPTATAAALTPAVTQPNRSSMNVGLVTDTGGVHDHAFNQLAWEGVQKAAREMGFQTTLIESEQPTDYEQNIDALATGGYNVIVTVGSLMGDATALKAKHYPNITFAIIDMMFAEDQVGFLAGVLAGGVSKSGFVCSTSSMRTPASDRYMISFRAGAVWQVGENTIRRLNNYINIQTTNTTTVVVGSQSAVHPDFPKFLPRCRLHANWCVDSTRFSRVERCG